MRKLAGRLVALSIGTSLASVLAFASAKVLSDNFGFGASPPCTLEDPSGLAGKASDRSSRAREEIDRLGQHQWAGVYRTPGSWPTELVIAPKAGFSIYKNSWCGNCASWVQTGTVL